jgi:hypothetical protein
MKYVGMIVILCFCFIVQGCKNKHVRDIEFEKVNQKICVLKPNVILNSDGFSQFDVSFFYANGNAVEDLTNKVYSSSIKNLNDHHQKYIFCLDQRDLKNDYLETQIWIELTKGKVVKEYEFRNYSCVLSGNTQLNLSKKAAITYCD